MAKSSSRSSFLVGIYIATVCFLGFCKAQSSYGGHNASVDNVGDPQPNDGISADPESDMNARSDFDTGTSEYKGTKIAGDQQYQPINDGQSFDNVAYTQNAKYMRNPSYYDPFDTLYDDEMENIRDPSSDDLLPVDGEGSAYRYTYESRNSYYNSSQQMDCGQYNSQEERDLCENDVRGMEGSSVNGIDSYRSTDENSSRGSLSGRSQSSRTGETYSNRMRSSNQASRGGSNRRNPARRVRPAFRGQSQSSRTESYRGNAARPQGPPPPYYTGRPRPNYIASSQSNYASSSQSKSENSAQDRHDGSNGGNRGGSSQRTYNNRSRSSQTGLRRGNVARPSTSYQTGPSRPIHAASSQGSRTNSSRFNNKASSQASSKGFDGRNVGRPSRPASKASSQYSDRGSYGRNEARPSGPPPTYYPGPPRPNYTGPPRPNYTGPPPPNYTGPSQPYYTGVARPDYKDSSQYRYADSSQSNYEARPSSSNTGAPVKSPNGLYRPNHEGEVHAETENPYVKQTAHGENSFSDTNSGSMEPDSDGLLLKFNGQLKILYGQFNEIRNHLLRYFDQVSHRLAGQVPAENQPNEFVPVIDDVTASMMQLNWSPNSALQQLYRRAKGVISICNEYITRNDVHISHGGENEASKALESLLSSLYQAGVLIIQEIGSNTASTPLSVQCQSDRNAKVRKFMITLRTLGMLFDRYINKVNNAIHTSYSQETIEPHLYRQQQLYLPARNAYLSGQSISKK